MYASRLLKAPREVCDALRKTIAQHLLDYCIECCDKMLNDGITSVIILQYKADLVAIVMSDGVCPRSFYCFLLLLRARISGHTADLEGMHYTLQVMANRGRNTRLPTADHRMALKYGDGVHSTSESCCSMASAVDAEMSESRYIHRYAMVEHVAGPDLPLPYAPKRCTAHSTPEAAIMKGVALALAYSAYRQIVLGAAFAFSLDSTFPNNVWLCPCSYTRVPFTVRATVKPDPIVDEALVLQIDVPLVISRLDDRLLDVTRLALDLNDNDPKVSLRIYRCPLKWVGMPKALLRKGAIDFIALDSKSMLRKAAAPAAPAADGGAAAAAPDGGDAADDASGSDPGEADAGDEVMGYGDIVDALGRILEEAQDLADVPAEDGPEPDVAEIPDDLSLTTSMQSTMLRLRPSGPT